MNETCKFNVAYSIELFYLRYTSRWSKGSVPRPTPTPNFVVSLKVGSRDFVGEGSTAQAAKHSAAAKAIQTLKVVSYLHHFDKKTLSNFCSNVFMLFLLNMLYDFIFV